MKTRIFVLKTDRAAPTIGKVPVAQKVQPIWQPTFPTRSQDHQNHQVTNIVSLCVPNLLQPLLNVKSYQGTQGTNHLSIQTTEGTTIIHWIEILPQGCRFGPESSRQTLVSPIFRSSLVPSVALLVSENVFRGQICNLGFQKDEPRLSMQKGKSKGSWQNFDTTALVAADFTLQTFLYLYAISVSAREI